MRVAHVVPKGEQPWSGVLTVIVHLASALARQGHEVQLYELHKWSADRYAEQRRRLEAAGVAEIVVPSPNAGRRAAALAERGRVDLVHLHSAFNPSNTSVSLSLRRPYVFSPHSGYDRVSLERRRVRKLVYATMFERRMLRRAALLAVLTEGELADLRRFGASGPAEIVPNGVEPPPPDLDREALRRELGLSPMSRVAAFVGRLDVHRKGLDLLVRGVAEAAGWHLALIGPPFRDVDGLRRQISELRVQDRVRFLGERHGRHLQESVAGADVFALLSRWEGQPMALLEALSLSVPAVVSPAVERAVGVEAAGAGWIADADSLGPLLRRLHGDPRAIEERRAPGAALARRHDWDSVGERYALAYERALGSARQVRFQRPHDEPTSR